MRAFTMILPPGWARIDLLGRPEEGARRFREATLLRCSPTHRHVIERALGTQWEEGLQQLAKDGAVCLISSLDAGVFSGMPTIVISEFPLQDDASPVDALVQIASADPTAALFDVADLVAIRTHEDRDRSESTFAELGATGLHSGDGLEGVRVIQRMHRYLLGDPVDRERWAVMTATTTAYLGVGEDEQPIEYFSDLLDDVVSSFRWTE